MSNRPTEQMTEAELIRQECELNISIRGFKIPESFAECVAQLKIINRAQEVREELERRTLAACV